MLRVAPSHYVGFWVVIEQTRGILADGLENAKPSGSARRSRFFSTSDSSDATSASQTASALAREKLPENAASARNSCCSSGASSPCAYAQCCTAAGDRGAHRTTRAGRDSYPLSGSCSRLTGLVAFTGPVRARSGVSGPSRSWRRGIEESRQSVGLRQLGERELDGEQGIQRPRPAPDAPRHGPPLAPLSLPRRGAAVTAALSLLHGK
jgi:hypothetical protein